MKPLLAILLLVNPSANQEMPPPPTIVADCFVPGPWIVFFEENGANLRKDAKPILHRMMEKWRDVPCGGFQISINGHTDLHERALIARRRAMTVRSYLIKAGMPSRNIRVRYKGSKEPRVVNSTDAAEPQNSRVELHAVWSE